MTGVARLSTPPLVQSEDQPWRALSSMPLKLALAGILGKDGVRNCSNVWKLFWSSGFSAMPEGQAVATRYASAAEQQRLWCAAIKWPIYSVAVMPALLAAGWLLGNGAPMRLFQLLGFLLAAALLLLWENVSNDLFDAETGIDSGVKPHSLVVLLRHRATVKMIALLALAVGLLLMLLLALRSSPAVISLVLLCCGMTVSSAQET